MAAGLPVIATNVGGIPELIHHGKNGYLIEKGDDVALSNRIIEMVLNPNKRDHMGKNARKFIMDYANVEKIANKKIKLYQKKIAQKYKTIILSFMPVGFSRIIGWRCHA